MHITIHKHGKYTKLQFNLVIHYIENERETIFMLGISDSNLHVALNNGEFKKHHQIGTSINLDCDCRFT